MTNATEVKALVLLDEAAQLAAEVDDQRAARAVLRVRARALRNVRSTGVGGSSSFTSMPFPQLGDYAAAVLCLQEGMAISVALQEYSGALTKHVDRCLCVYTSLCMPTGDADSLGELADLYVELGDMERAAEVCVHAATSNGAYQRCTQLYDRCIKAIQEETPASLSSTWDCGGGPLD